MLTNRGQAIDTAIVWSVVTLLVAVGIGGLIFSKIHAEAEESAEKNSISHSFSLSDTTFSENIENSAISSWTAESTSDHPVEWDGTNEWAYISSTKDNASAESTDNITQSINVNLYDELESATASWAWKIAENDNLTDLDLYAELQDPDGNWSTVWKQEDHTVKDPAFRDEENDVSSMIDESGSWTLRLQTHITTDDNDSAQVNFDNTNLSVSTDEDSIGEDVNEEAGEGASTVFPLLVLAVIITVFVALIGVLRAL